MVEGCIEITIGEVGRPVIAEFPPPLDLCAADGAGGGVVDDDKSHATHRHNTQLLEVFVVHAEGGEIELQIAIKPCRLQAHFDRLNVFRICNLLRDGGRCCDELECARLVASCPGGVGHQIGVELITEAYRGIEGVPLPRNSLPERRKDKARNCCVCIKHDVLLVLAVPPTNRHGELVRHLPVNLPECGDCGCFEVKGERPDQISGRDKGRQ